MPIRHYLTLLGMLGVILSGLFAITFANRDVDPRNLSDDAPGIEDEESIAGQWSTSYGPMVIEVQSRSSDGQIEHVVGQWTQSGNTGFITSGRYDRTAREFDFQFSEPWHSATGQARFTLGANNTMQGTWKFTGTNGLGNWSMWRPGTQNAVQDPGACSPGPPPVAPALRCGVE